MDPGVGRPDGGLPADGIRVDAIVRAVVAELAPAELPVAEGLAALPRRAVRRRLRGRLVRRERLGFGLGEVAGMLTPVVWLAVDESARRLAGDATVGLVGRIIAWLRRLRGHGGPNPVRLTGEQLAAIHRQVVGAGLRQGLSFLTAEALADAVVARLALPAQTGLPGSTAAEEGRPDATSTGS